MFRARTLGIFVLFLLVFFTFQRYPAVAVMIILYYLYRKVFRKRYRKRTLSTAYLLKELQNCSDSLKNINHALTKLANIALLGKEEEEFQTKDITSLEADPDRSLRYEKEVVY